VPNAFTEGSVWNGQLVLVYKDFIKTDPVQDVTVGTVLPNFVTFRLSGGRTWQIHWKLYDRTDFNDVTLALHADSASTFGIRAVWYRFWPKT
jgi:hypothetical protein